MGDTYCASFPDDPEVVDDNFASRADEKVCRFDVSMNELARVGPQGQQSVGDADREPHDLLLVTLVLVCDSAKG